MKDFLISYCWADQAIVRPLAEQLNAKGFSVWIDDRSMTPGDIPDEVQFALKQCHTLILMWSRSAYISKWVHDEWSAALTSKKTIIPCLLDDTPLPHELTTLLRVDLHADPNGTSRLIQTMQNQVVKRKEMAKDNAEFTEPPETSKTIRIQNLPHQDNPNFTGREQYLHDIRRALIDKTAAIGARPVVVSGLGGVGKTQLITHYVNLYRSDYEVIWWLSAVGPVTLSINYAALAQPLNLPQRDEAKQETVIQAVKRWLEENNHWLLIFDNAENPETVRPFLPKNKNGHILITSRNPNWQPLAGSSIFSLSVWQRPESIMFLFKRTNQQNEKQAAQLAETLGDLPLALEQAAAYVAAAPGFSMHEYRSRFEEYRKELLKRDRPIDYPDTVATTWEISFGRLKKERPEAIGLLQLCAFLAPDGIPLELLRNGMQKTLKSPIDFDDAVRALQNYSLIKGQNGNFSLHRLVQAVTSDRLSEFEQKKWAQTALQAINRVWPREAHDFRTWSQCERLLSHGYAGLRYAERLEIASTDLAKLMNGIGLYLTKRAAYSAAEPLLRRALKIREKQLGPDHADVAESLNNLAILLQGQGNYAAAEPLLRRTLDIDEKLLGPDGAHVAASLINIANGSRNQEHYGEAMRLLRRALKISEKQPGHQYLAASLTGLADLLLSEGDDTAAEPLIRRALEIREKQLGPEHPDVAASLRILALLLQKQGNYVAAEPLFRRALKIHEKQLGPDHPDVAKSLDNLAALFKVQGNDAAAEPLYRRAFEINEKKFGPEHPDVVESLRNLASLLQEQGNYAAAEPLARRLLEFEEKQRGPKHWAVAFRLENLADLLEEQGYYAAAEPLYRRALKILENYLGREHKDVAERLTTLAKLLQKQGNYAEVEPLLRCALKIREKQLGPDHADVAESLNNLAALFKKQGNDAAAEPLLRRAEKIRKDSLDSLLAEFEIYQQSKEKRIAREKE